MRRKKGKPPVCGICDIFKALYKAPLRENKEWTNICEVCSEFFTIPDHAYRYGEEPQSGRILLAEVYCPACGRVNLVSGKEQYTCECGVEVKI